MFLSHNDFSVVSAAGQREIDAEYAAVEASAKNAKISGMARSVNPWRPRSFKWKLWEKAYDNA